MTLDEMILEFKESADGQEQRLKGLREKDIHTSILEGTYLYDPHRVARIMEKKMRRWRRRLSRWRRYDS